MKVHAIGVVRMSGKKNGREYDFSNLLALQPVEIVSREGFSKTGHGYETAEFEAAPEAVASFAGVTFPAQLELKTETRVQFGKLRTVIVGFSPAAKV